MSFWQDLGDVLEDAWEGHKWEAEQKREIMKERKKMALTCRRCQNLAMPIPETRNRYRCEHCGNQFAAARHDIIF